MFAGQSVIVPGAATHRGLSSVVSHSGQVGGGAGLGRSLCSCAGGQCVPAVRDLGESGREAWELAQGGWSSRPCPSPAVHVLDDAAADHTPLCQRLQPAARGPPGFRNHQWAGECPTALGVLPHTGQRALSLPQAGTPAPGRRVLWLRPVTSTCLWVQKVLS